VEDKKKESRGRERERWSESGGGRDGERVGEGEE